MMMPKKIKPGQVRNADSIINASGGISGIEGIISARQGLMSSFFQPVYPQDAQ